MWTCKMKSKQIYWNLFVEYTDPDIETIWRSVKRFVK